MHRLCLGYVQSLRKHFGPVLFLNALRRRPQCLAIASTHCDPATLGGKGFRGRATNPLTRGRDDRHTAFQTCVHGVGIIKYVGLTGLVETVLLLTSPVDDNLDGLLLPVGWAK
jgi:hypothetical protein